MVKTNRKQKPFGIGFCGLIVIALIILRLTHHIEWSWWIVLAPLYVPLIFWIVAFGFTTALIWKEQRQGKL
jgi:hypothetical protein